MAKPDEVDVIVIRRRTLPVVKRPLQPRRYGARTAAGDAQAIDHW